ncbi:MAG TPA: DegT/DnrJ/EryC1/StrS family aminotransferase [Methylocella sp.]|nr:DegT/DnrJ/EryC1/StrS family aminotransferase [Methylocella sp.]
MVNSWTNGAVAALLALDIGPGDEVIVPAQTFITTANVAELIGAKPVFVDVDPATLLMRPERVRTALTPRMELKIVEVPIIYRGRAYGETNISRWRHGVILLAMLAFAVVSVNHGQPFTKLT